MGTVGGDAGDEHRRASASAPSVSAADLEAAARPLIEGGRPDLLGLDPTTIDWASFQGRPWARLAVAAALIAADPGYADARKAIRSAQRSFRARGDSVGLGYAAYVDGTRYLGLGRHREAAITWREVREQLGDDSPVSCNALAHLSVVANDRFAQAVDLTDVTATGYRVTVSGTFEGPVSMRGMRTPGPIEVANAAFATPPDLTDGPELA